ncbi:deoxyuridine 5'-triphosphate nucleotidohydrolase [Candidatus Micrarchaeota archaeon]|nr:deoxyuridine 5'-triphosphate nucleotidohydrolase [Candidatus Micrarchaeota archaeon]
MILPKELILKNNLVRDNISSEQFQPCGVDMTLKTVFAFKNQGSVDFDNKERRLSDCEEIKFENDWVELKKGVYKVMFNEIVKIPNSCMGLAFPRSSLLRCGVSLGCAVWDPGYEGRSESLLIVGNESGIRLKRNAKLIQMVFVTLKEDAKELYSGQYKGENI